MKKIVVYLLSIVMLFTITACGSDDKKELSNNESETSQKEENNKKEENNNQQEENNSSNNVIDDEIIDIEAEENHPIVERNVNVEEVINCDNCVYAYFSGEGTATKKIGDTLSKGEYTTDITTLKTAGGKQRHNFFGLVLSGNTISRAYSCILKDNKIYCIEGSVNGAYHDSNIGVLNQIFTSGQCRTISDGNTYTCTDGSYNGDTKTSGYTSLHYETSCTIYGANARTGELICH